MDFAVHPASKQPHLASLLDPPRSRDYIVAAQPARECLDFTLHDSSPAQALA